MKEIANSDSSFAKIVSDMAVDYDNHHYLRVSWTTKKDRTLDQNALWQAMYARISETMCDGSVTDIQMQKAYCKLMFGVPILRRDDEQFEKGWNRYFGGRSYEEQMFLMGPNPLFGVDGFPVTRLLNTKQGAEYTELVDMHFTQLGVFFGDLLEKKK